MDASMLLKRQTSIRLCQLTAAEKLINLSIKQLFPPLNPSYDGIPFDRNHKQTALESFLCASPRAFSGCKWYEKYISHIISKLNKVSKLPVSGTKRSLALIAFMSDIGVRQIVPSQLAFNFESVSQKKTRFKLAERT